MITQALKTLQNIEDLLLYLVKIKSVVPVTLADVSRAARKDSPSAGSPSPDGDARSAGDSPQSPAGHPIEVRFEGPVVPGVHNFVNPYRGRRGYLGPLGEKLRAADETSPAEQAGAGKGGAPVPPTAGASAVLPGEASPIASPGQHGKFCVSWSEAFLFNVDCGDCAEAQTLAGISVLTFIRDHQCNPKGGHL